jgi:phospholipid/cholesterol/gamma-HCH transport system substrate-binding protein
MARPGAETVTSPLVTSPSLNTRRSPPYKTVGAVFLLTIAALLALVYLQFRGDFTAKTQLTMVAGRAGLVMDPGSKVTYNGVEIGRVGDIVERDVDGVPAAQLTLNVDPKYIPLIPANVDAAIKATTVFGNKYVSFTSPKDPTPQRISSSDRIDARAVTTEFNTLFETITQIAQTVDPVKLNLTLSAAAQALTGLGTKFGQSIVAGDAILADVNPRLPQLQHDNQSLAKLADVYSAAAPNLFDALNNAVTTARTFNDQRGNLDAGLLAAVGFGNTGADVLGRAEPYLVAGQADLVATTSLLDKYSPELFCVVRNFHDVLPAVKASFGGNGYSLATDTELDGAQNPYVYPDNLPRVHATGGPGGQPGCWQSITRDLWPAPYLVMDTGASDAPNDHFRFGQPLVSEYVFGRQLGENTINP